jgi:ABC-type amino acid transport substrate-binding protein
MGEMRKMKKMTVWVTKAVVLAVLSTFVLLTLASCADNTPPAPATTPAATEPAVSESADAADGRAFIPDPNRVYTIMTGFDFPPFQYFDPEVGEVVGFDLDLFRAIAEDQGFNFEFSHDTFSANMGAVQSGAADGMIAAMTITEARRESFDFSDGYFNAGQILTVGIDSEVTGMADLAGQIVAAKIGTVSAVAAEHYREV